MNSLGFEFVQILADDLSKGTAKLPSLPDVALKIKTILEDPNVSAKQVAEVVQADATFAARLLKVANSAALNASGQAIGDIPTAIARIGFKMAHSIAVAIALDQLTSIKLNGAAGKKLKNLWHHSNRVAALSWLIAKNHSKVKPDEALLGGLLHDVGKIYLLSQIGNHEGLNEEAVIDDILYDWHTGVGAAILEAWHFNEVFVTVADEHELLDRSPTNSKGEIRHEADLTDVVAIANQFALLQERGTPEQIPEALLNGVMRRLSLTERDVHSMLYDSEDEIAAISAALSC